MRKSFPILLTAVITITFLCYWPALKADFVQWDDDVHILNNISIRALDSEHLKDIFTTTVNKIYIPLTSLSFALEHHFFGFKPFIYHLDNLFLHLGIVVLIFIFARRLGLGEWAAGIAALIFGIHPMHVESAAWVTERKDVLYAFFYMAALIAYTRYLDSQKAEKGKRPAPAYGWMAATTLWGTLSILSKPMALSLPLILFLLDWFKGRPLRKNILEKIPLIVIIGAITLITYVANARIPGQNPIEAILIWSWTFCFYLRQFFIPLFFVPVYELPKPVSLSNPEFLLSVLVMGLSILAVVRLRKYRWFTFAFLFYFLSIFFILRFDEVKDANIVADRFMYLPSLGFCLLLGLAAEQWQKQSKNFVTIAVIIIMGFLSWRTYSQVSVWNDSLSLWRHETKIFPENNIGLNNFATVLRDEKEYKEAEQEYRKILQTKSQGQSFSPTPESIESLQKVNYIISLYERSIRSSPNFEDARYNLAQLYKDLGRSAEAIQYFKETININPTYKDAYFSLAGLYEESGDWPKAVESYDQTLGLMPDNEDAYINVISAYTKVMQKKPGQALYQSARREALEKYFKLLNEKPPRAQSFLNLGNIFTEMGDYERAIAAYRRVLDMNPTNSKALNNLGNLYKRGGEREAALSYFEKSIQADSRNVDAYVNSANVYAQQKQYDKAESLYKKALSINSKNSLAYFNLGYIYEMNGQLKKAVEAYRSAAEFDPQNAEAYYNLGNVYVQLEDGEGARQAYLKAVELKPSHMDAWVNLSVLAYKVGDFVNAVKYCDEAVLLGYDAPEEYLKELEKYRK